MSSKPTTPPIQPVRRAAGGYVVTMPDGAEKTVPLKVARLKFQTNRREKGRCRNNWPTVEHAAASLAVMDRTRESEEYREFTKLRLMLCDLEGFLCDFFHTRTCRCPLCLWFCQLDADSPPDEPAGTRLVETIRKLHRRIKPAWVGVNGLDLLPGRRSSDAV